MKVKINKKLKIGLIAILVISIITSSFLLYKTVKYPGYKNYKVPLYSYNNKGTVNYKVFLRPNILYETNSLDEGMLYITELVDYIKATFNYEFSGNKVADIKGTYDIMAKVQGFNTEKEKIVNIWEKNYTLVPKKSFTVDDKTKSIKEEINIRLNEYNDFVKQVIEATKINCETNLNIVMNINLSGNIDNNQIDETIIPSIVIPLNVKMFQVTGNTNIEKSGAIEETKQVQLPVNRKQVILYGIILGILVIILSLLIFLTEPVEAMKDPHEKLLKQIFKKHGDRLVALNGDLAFNTDGAAMVKSIDDLVRIADEVAKPIMYKYSPEYKEIDKFYLANGNEVYILDVNHMLEEIELREKNNGATDEAEELIDKVKKFKAISKDNEEESKMES